MQQEARPKDLLGQTWKEPRRGRQCGSAGSHPLHDTVGLAINNSLTRAHTAAAVQGGGGTSAAAMLCRGAKGRRSKD